MRAVFHGVPKEKKKRKIQFRRISIVSVFIGAHMFALAVLFLVAKSRKLRVPPRILRMTEVNLRIKAYSCHIIRTTLSWLISPARATLPSLLRGRRGNSCAFWPRGPGSLSEKGVPIENKKWNARRKGKKKKKKIKRCEMLRVPYIFVKWADLIVFGGQQVSNWNYYFKFSTWKADYLKVINYLIFVGVNNFY